MAVWGSSKRLLGAGLVAGLVAVLGGVSWAASAASKSQLISQEQAQESIARFRASASPGAARAHLFARSAFDALLAQPGAAGLRIYYGKYADGSDTLVLYATDKDGQDLTDTTANLPISCPPNCDPITPAAALSLRSHIVSQEHAQETISRFRASAAPGAVRAQSLDRSGVDALLAQPGAAGIRIHHARDSDGGDTFVLHATDKDGRDLPQAAVNRTMSCPPTCSDSETEAP